MADKKDQVYRCDWNQLHRAAGKTEHRDSAEAAETEYSRIKDAGGKPKIFFQYNHFTVVNASPSDPQDWQHYLLLNNGAKDCTWW